MALRVLTVWIHDHAGKSVFAATLFHSMVNLSTYVFPNHASHRDPRTAGPVTATAAAIATVLWGPRSPAGRVRG